MLKKNLSLLIMAALSMASSNVMALVPAGACAADVVTLVNGPATPANVDYKILEPKVRLQVVNFTNLLNLVNSQATYQTLLTAARTLAATIPPVLTPVAIPAPGRVVITLPDGTVVIDTGKLDDPTNLTPLALGNSYAHFLAKTVNENHNSRVAIFDAQEYPCGTGVETKFSSTDGRTEAYVAIRLGTHLNNAGTVRFSLKK
jgi:hypothetical protein